jgi:hypothetical protein
MEDLWLVFAALSVLVLPLLLAWWLLGLGERRARKPPRTKGRAKIHH